MFKVQSIHSEFYALWVNKKGLFIEKITLNSIQDWWRLDISQHQTVQSVSGIWLVSVDSFCCPCRRCLVSWVGPFFLPYKEKKIWSEPSQHSQMLNAIFLICESNSHILLTETKVYKSNTWNKKSGYSTSIWAIPQWFLSTQEQGTWEDNGQNIYSCGNSAGPACCKCEEMSVLVADTPIIAMGWNEQKVWIMYKEISCPQK